MDRERVMKGLEIIHNGCDEIQCEDCCFNIKEPAKPRRCGIDEEQIHQDAIALLKEQEAVKPVPPEDEFSLYRCGKCYHQLFRCVDKYCSRCGQAVKWE